MKYFISTLISCVSFVAPANAQMLLDAAAGAAIQSSLQSTGSGNALQLLQDAQSLRNISNQSPLTPGQIQPTRQPTKPTANNKAAPLQMLGSEVLFSVNAHGIQLCSSRLPCLWQMRRAMGLR